ncbi:hypothetical protein F183_A06690 [Bryobacterales bacterium F-183]|nr:hypothetical protein F183_A06690 [Bryobacterales bacterium F-183]
MCVSKVDRLVYRDELSNSKPGREFLRIDVVDLPEFDPLIIGMADCRCCETRGRYRRYFVKAKTISAPAELFNPASRLRAVTLSVATLDQPGDVRGAESPSYLKVKLCDLVPG